LQQIKTEKIQIRPTLEENASILTEIACAAKRHWNYPEHYYEIWRDELTITADYIIKNIVYHAVCQESIIGFYSIVEVTSDFYAGEVLIKKGFWLEHLFVNPEFHRMGIGRRMTDHAKKVSKKLGISQLLIFADPFAKGFYDKIGAEFLYLSKSSIKDRMIPVYGLNVS
jgi:GNAT superfamily N-acetyltransferase